MKKCGKIITEADYLPKMTMTIWGAWPAQPPPGMGVNFIYLFKKNNYYFLSFISGI
jgi:hypothetical protein